VRLFFRTTIWNKILHEMNKDYGIIIENFVRSKDQIIRSTIFPRNSIHEFTWTSPNWTRYIFNIKLTTCRLTAEGVQLCYVLDLSRDWIVIIPTIWWRKTLGRDLTPWPLIRKRTIPTWRPPFVGEIYCQLSRIEGCCVVGAAGPPRPLNLSFLYRSRYFAFK
jgi:hypothetical protein